jgi:hypothetical protein
MRKRRWRLRQDLKRLVPALDVDPIPTGGDAYRFELDPAVVASDVHRFLELLQCARRFGRTDAINAYEEALALYEGDLLDRSDVPNWWWLYDGPQVDIELRSDYRRMHREARRRLADLRAAGTDDADLRRAQELYIGLTRESTDDERLWAMLFDIQGRRGDELGLEASVRRLRMALVEFGKGENVDHVMLPANLARDRGRARWVRRTVTEAERVAPLPVNSLRDPALVRSSTLTSAIGGARSASTFSTSASAGIATSCRQHAARVPPRVRCLLGPAHGGRLSVRAHGTVRGERGPLPRRPAARTPGSAHGARGAGAALGTRFSRPRSRYGQELQKLRRSSSSNLSG